MRFERERGRQCGRVVVALSFDPRANFRVLALKSLDAFEHLAGSIIWSASFAGTK